MSTVKKNMNVCSERLRAAERLIARQKMRKEGGWKCETEGEGKSDEKERMENRQRNILSFYLLLIKLITLSVREIESGIDRDRRGGRKLLKS